MNVQFCSQIRHFRNQPNSAGKDRKKDHRKKNAKLKPINFRKQTGLGKPPVVIYLVHFRGLSVVANYANC